MIQISEKGGNSAPLKGGGRAGLSTKFILKVRRGGGGGKGTQFLQNPSNQYLCSVIHFSSNNVNSPGKLDIIQLI